MHPRIMAIPYFPSIFGGNPYQFHLVAGLRILLAPVMGARAGLHRHHAVRLRRQKRQDLGPRQQGIRRGSFANVKKLTRKINAFVDQYNAQASPFVWVATADSILAKIKRLCLLISGTQH